MAYYLGRLQGPKLEPTVVTVEIDDGRMRITAGRRHMGSWPLPSMEIHRTSIYRFAFAIEGDSFEFFPEDPSAFSDAAGAVVDLTGREGRYGLKARIQDATSA
ncbi:MAG: hypothetical protein ACRDZM_04385 [Acidimicrobiia bacterium]